MASSDCGSDVVAREGDVATGHVAGFGMLRDVDFEALGKITPFWLTVPLPK
jgi:hypothetical protein